MNRRYGEILLNEDFMIKENVEYIGLLDRYLGYWKFIFSAVFNGGKLKQSL
jgi:hypothetical protein